MTVKEKMHNGELYFPSHDEIMKEQTLCLEKLFDFNATRPLEGEKRTAMLKEMFPKWGRTAISSRHFMLIGADIMCISVKGFMPILI